jgi:hypothetical protein
VHFALGDDLRIASIFVVIARVPVQSPLICRVSTDDLSSILPTSLKQSLSSSAKSTCQTLLEPPDYDLLERPPFLSCMYACAEEIPTSRDAPA